MYDPTKAIAGWLIENPQVEKVVDHLAATYGPDLKLHIVDAETAQAPMFNVNDVVATTPDNKEVWVIHPNGSVEGTTEVDV